MDKKKINKTKNEEGTDLNEWKHCGSGVSDTGKGVKEIPARPWGIFGRESGNDSSAQMAHMHEPYLSFSTESWEFVNGQALPNCLAYHLKRPAVLTFDPMTSSRRRNRHEIREQYRKRVLRRLYDEAVEFYRSVKGRPQKRV